MKTFLNFVITLSALLLGSPGMASQTRVIINLSDQRASLVQQGRITLVSPIASGKTGWSTPRGNFSIFNKDIDHRSRSFGSVFGRRQHAQPDSHPKGHAAIAHRFICSGSALMEVADQGEVCRDHWTKVQ